MAMTARERRERAKARQALYDAGVLHRKKPLNRKKFCDEAREILNNWDIEYEFCLLWALGEVLERHEWPAGTVSPEAVGVAKVLKLAKARSDFIRQKREAGETSYKIGDLIAVTEDIYNA